MGVLSNSAIIFLILCIGENGLFGQSLDLTSFDELFQVANLALPDLSKNITEMSSIEIHKFVKAEYKKEKETRWQITVVVGENRGHMVKTKKVTFEVHQLPKSDCPQEEKICVRHPIIIDSPNEENGMLPEGWKTVPNLNRFHKVYRVVRISLPNLKIGLGMPSIKILHFLDASKLINRGTQWKVSLVVTGTSEDDFEVYQVKFTAFQLLSKHCNFNEPICLRDFNITDVISPHWRPVTNLPQFGTLYKVIDASIPLMVNDTLKEQIEVVHLLGASHEMVGRTSLWKIWIEYRTTSGQGKFDNFESTFQVYQPHPSECVPLGTVCVKNYQKINDIGNSIPDFSLFSGLYQASKLVVPHLKRKWNVSSIEIDHFVSALFQPVAGNNWKITVDVPTPYLFKQVSFEVYQPLPCRCNPYGRVCVENIANVHISVPEF